MTEVVDEPVEPAEPAGEPTIEDRADSKLSQRMRRTYGDALERGHAIEQRVEDLRPDTPLLDAGFDLYERDAAAGGSLLGGAVAFRLFLLMVPFLLLIYSALGFWQHADNPTPNKIGQGMGFSGSLLSAMGQAGKDASHGRWLTLFIGLWALVLAMRSLIKSLRIVHILAWDLERKRSARTVRSVLVGIGVLAGIMVFAIFGSWLRDHTVGGGVMASIFLGAIWVAIWLGVSMLLPRPEGIRWTALVPGAVLFGLAAEGLHAATVFYFAGRVARMSATYGPLGVAAGMLLWLFIVARCMVASAMLNATLWNRAQRGLTSFSPIDVKAIVGSSSSRDSDTDS